MFEFVLPLHLLGATIMAFSALVAISALVRGRVVSLGRHSLVLSALFVFQSLTGAMLGLLSPDASLLRFCASFGIYLAVFFVLQFALALRLSPERFAPRAAVAAGSFGSVVFLATLPALF